MVCCRYPVLLLFSSYGFMNWRLCHAASWQHGTKHVFTPCWGGKRWWIDGKRSSLSEKQCHCKSISICSRGWISLLSSLNISTYSKAVKVEWKVWSIYQMSSFPRAQNLWYFCWIDLWNAPLWFLCAWEISNRMEWILFISVFSFKFYLLNHLLLTS